MLVSASHLELVLNFALVQNSFSTASNHSHQCCIFRSVSAGTDGKSRTGMQTGTRHPHVPPRPKFLPVSACFGRFGLFRPFWPVLAGICNPAGILFWLFIYIFFLSSFFFFFLLLSSAQLSLSVSVPFLYLFLFLFFGSSAVIAVIAVKPEMKKKKKTEVEMDRLQWP